MNEFYVVCTLIKLNNNEEIKHTFGGKTINVKDAYIKAIEFSKTMTNNIIIDDKLKIYDFDSDTLKLRETP